MLGCTEQCTLTSVKSLNPTVGSATDPVVTLGLAGGTRECWRPGRAGTQHTKKGVKCEDL